MRNMLRMALLGMAVKYFLHPERGAGRRAMIRNRALGLLKRGGSPEPDRPGEGPAPRKG